MNTTSSSRSALAAGLGFLLILPLLFFMTANLLNFNLGISLLYGPLDAFLADPARFEAFNDVSPFVFTGGLAVAFLLNAWTVIQIRFRQEPGVLLGTIRLQIRFWNLVILGLVLLLGFGMGLYLVAENLPCRC